MEIFTSRDRISTNHVGALCSQAHSDVTSTWYLHISGTSDVTIDTGSFRCDYIVMDEVDN